MKSFLTVSTLIAAFLATPALAAHHMSNHMEEWDEQQMQMHNDEMEAHLAEMQVLMDKLHMTMGMMGGGPRHGGSMPEGEKRRQYMIEKRLDMMDNAMEMMMQRDEMMMH